MVVRITVKYVVTNLSWLTILFHKIDIILFSFFFINCSNFPDYLLHNWHEKYTFHKHTKIIYIHKTHDRCFFSSNFKTPIDFERRPKKTIVSKRKQCPMSMHVCSNSNIAVGSAAQDNGRSERVAQAHAPVTSVVAEL